MLLGLAKSVNGILIRLTEERWRHIVYSHKEIEPAIFKKVLKVIEKPSMILEGDFGELLAVSKLPGRKLWLVVVYKEEIKDGFVITTYMTSDIRWLLKRKIVWIKK